MSVTSDSNGEWTAERIIALREQLGVSRGKLSRLLDVDQSTVWLWEKGKRQPNAHTSRALWQVERLAFGNGQERRALWRRGGQDTELSEQRAATEDYA